MRYANIPMDQKGTLTLFHNRKFYRRRSLLFLQQADSGRERRGLPGKGELLKVEVETGEMKVIAGSEYRGFAMDWYENYGVMVKGNIVCRYDCDTDKITELGTLPEGGSITGHLTISKNGMIVCGYKQWNCIYALVVLIPKPVKAKWFIKAITI